MENLPYSGYPNQFYADLAFCLKTKVALSDINKKRCNSYCVLKPKQFDCVKRALSGDTLIILPTGYGKSLIYELVQKICQTKIIIISPINAIINEQLGRFGGEAIKVDREFAQQIEKDNIDSLKKMLENASFILGHPEAFIEKGVCDLFVKIGGVHVSHIFIDEVHCVVSWGSDFRPAFQKVTKLRSIFPSAKLVGMTATATVKMQHAIRDLLQMKEVCIISTNPNRENIKITVKKRPATVGSKSHVDDVYEDLIMPFIHDLCNKGSLFEKTIIFTSLKLCGLGYEIVRREALRRKTVDKVMPCVSQYHAPSTDEKKKKITCDLRNVGGEIKLLFATEAYGMGADSPDIRRIIHIGPPTSLETYLQEIGRAGRDGKSSTAVLYYNTSDIGENKANVKPEVREFCVTETCRRDFLCNHFGFNKPETYQEMHQCCDICENKCDCDICVMDKLTLSDMTEDTSDLEEDESQTDEGFCLHLKCCLKAYFEMENHCDGSLCTGLTEELMSEIVNTSWKLKNESDVQSLFPNLHHTYVKNISKIILQVKDTLHANE